MIERFLKAGYFEFHQVHNSLSGTPQGSGASPILANIYLHELDKYCEELSKQYTQGKARKRNPQYQALIDERQRALKNNDKQKAKQLLKQMRTIPSKDLFDESFTRVNYCRYADDVRPEGLTVDTVGSWIYGSLSLAR